MVGFGLPGIFVVLCVCLIFIDPPQSGQSFLVAISGVHTNTRVWP